MTAASSPKRAAQIKTDAAATKATIEALMSTIAGRRWVWLELEQGNIFNDAENLDPSILAHAMGKRSAGLRLFRSVTRLTPQQYIRMTEENTGVQIEDNSNGRIDSDDSDSGE